MRKEAHNEWQSVTIGTDQRDASGYGATESFTVDADGTWSKTNSFFTENTGAVSLQMGTLSVRDLKLLDKLLDIINREPIPDHTTQVSHHVPQDKHSLVLNNPGQSETLFENLDERASHPGAYFAYDDRADIVEIAAADLFMELLDHKYTGDDFLM